MKNDDEDINSLLDEKEDLLGQLKTRLSEEDYRLVLLGQLKTWLSEEDYRLVLRVALVSELIGEF